VTSLDLRPTWDAYNRWSGGVWAAVSAVAVFVGIGAISTWGSPHALETIAVIIGVVLLIAVPAVAHVAITIRSSSLTLEAMQLVHRSYGRSTTLRNDGGIAGLLAPYVTPTGNGGSQTVDMLILVGPDGRRVRLNGGYWSRDDLESVAQAVGATIDRTPRSAKEWERDLPGSMGFVARRPVATAFLIVLVLLVLIAGGIAIGLALSS
jgi:hypothetical protein